MKKMIFCFLFLGSLLFAQSAGSEFDQLQAYAVQLESALAKRVVKIENMSVNNAQLQNIIKTIKADLLRIETKEQLDSLKVAYGLVNR